MIEAALEGTDVLAVMPTGYGKSALYQVPGGLRGGVSVVVSPLVALQRDQARAITRCPDLPAPWTLDSRTGARQEARMWQALESGQPAFVFVTPEQLAKDEVVARLGALELTQVVVDEAHCISAWGHGFRPDYLQLGAAVERLGHPPVMALTATASGPVRDEVLARLGMADPVVMVRGFDRPNLHLAVRREVSDGDKRADVVEAVVQLAAEGPGCGLLYVPTRKDTDRYAAELSDRGVSALAYHGGMRSPERRRVHERFTSGTVDVVVATSAFGMGIDRPDVRFVVHAAVPQSPDSYYQEIGRAGRDGGPARALLFYRPEDFALHRFHTSASVDPVVLEQVLGAVVRNGSMPTKVLRNLEGLAPRTAARAVNDLELAGVLRVKGATVSTVSTALGAGANRIEEAVERAVEAATTRARVSRTRVEMMRGYAEATQCRRQFLLGYLGEQLDAPCGSCDRCEEEPSQQRPSQPEVSDAFPVHSKVAHREWGAGVVMTREPDRVTVLFEREGYRTLSVDAVQREELLTLT